MRHSTFPRSCIVLLGSNSIESLLPSTIISQAESLLDAHRIQDAIGLADQQRKKIEAKLTVDDDEVSLDLYLNGFRYSCESRPKSCATYTSE